jgi:malonyl-CoA O-methyltransferase
MAAEHTLPIASLHVALQFTRRAAAQPFLYQEIGERMAQRLDLIKLNPAHIVDAGCGAGSAVSLLHQRYPKAQLLGLDHPSRIAQARQVWPDTRLRTLLRTLTGGPRLTWCAQDFSAGPAPPAQVDLLWSNCALHWTSAPHQVIAQWASWLNTGGLLMFSTFGPDTFKQVRQAASQAGLINSTLPFVDMHDFGDMMVAAGLATPVMDVETLTLTYTSAAALIDDLRALGGNAHAQRTAHLVSRARWQRFLQALDAQQDPQGRIALTVEVAYGHAWKPAPRRTDSQVHTVSVEALRATHKRSN